MKVSIFLLFTILTVLQAASQCKKKSSRLYQIGDSGEDNRLSSKINLEPEYTDDDEDTHFHTNVKVVCHHGKKNGSKKLKNTMDYSDGAENNRRTRTSRSSKKARSGMKSSRRKKEKKEKEYEQDRELVQARNLSGYENEMNYERFGKEDFANQESEREIYSNKRLGKLNRASANQESERKIYSNKRSGKSNQKVFNEDFDDESLGTINGPKRASPSLYGEGDGGVNSYDTEYGSNQKVLNEGFVDETLGTNIGPKRASPSLYGEGDDRLNSGDKEYGNNQKVLNERFDNETLGSNIGPKSASTSLYGEGDDRLNSGDKEYGNNQNVLQKQVGTGFGGWIKKNLHLIHQNFSGKKLGTGIEPELSEPSLYGEGDERSASGCPYKSCSCGGCKKCGGCTISDCKCNGINGMQEGRGLGRSEGNGLKVVRNNFDSKTLGTSIDLEPESSSRYDKVDERSASGCPNKSCKGCKRCEGNNPQFVRKSVAVIDPVTFSRPVVNMPFRWNLFR